MSVVNGVALSQVRYSNLVQGECEPRLLVCGGDMATWGQETMQSLSQAAGMGGGRRFGELALLSVGEWRLIPPSPPPQMEWSKSSQDGCEKAI